MSNIYEALQQAQNRKTPAWPSTAKEEPKAGSSPTVGRIAEREGDPACHEMCTLFHNIEHLLPDIPRKIIQFIGCREGEGVSTITRRFARTAVEKFGRRVLIVDAAHHNPTQHIHFNAKADVTGWKNTMGQEHALDGSFFEAGANLFLLPVIAQPSLMPQVHNREDTTTIFQKLRTIFDLVIIDSSPAAASPDSLALAACCDGVVLVLEAEKTRSPMAENVKEKIARHGGNLLGIVFNKRRFHIPEFLYQRL